MWQKCLCSQTDCSNFLCLCEEYEAHDCAHACCCPINDAGQAVCRPGFAAVNREQSNQRAEREQRARETERTERTERPASVCWQGQHKLCAGANHCSHHWHSPSPPSSCCAGGDGGGRAPLAAPLRALPAGSCDGPPGVLQLRRAAAVGAGAAGGVALSARHGPAHPGRRLDAGAARPPATPPARNPARPHTNAHAGRAARLGSAPAAAAAPTHTPGAGGLTSGRAGCRPRAAWPCCPRYSRSTAG